jgi:hypothetical protein
VFNPDTDFFEGWAPGTSDPRSHSVSIDYRHIKALWGPNTPGWVELIFAVQGSNRNIKYIDDVRLVVPEPASLTLLAFVPVALCGVRRRRG